MSIDFLKNGSTLKNTRSRQYPTESIMNANYANDLVLLANTPVKDESMLLYPGAGGIDLCELKF